MGSSSSKDDSITYELVTEMPADELVMNAPPDGVEVDNSKVLGSGAQGTVLRGRWPNPPRDCAIKKTRVRNFGMDLDDAKESIVGEAKKLADLSSSGAEYVVPYYGCWAEGEFIYVAMKFMRKGDLLSQLRADLPFDRRLKLASDIARGIAEIHRAGFIHYDLKPQNILFDIAECPRIADLGLAESLAEVKGQSRIQRGSACYKAPEICRGQAVSQKVDIFSLGMLMWVLWNGKADSDGGDPLRTHLYSSGQGPTSDLDVDQWIASKSKMVRPRATPRTNDAAERNFITIMTECWADDPDDRPTAGEVAAKLNAARGLASNPRRRGRPAAAKVDDDDDDDDEKGKSKSKNEDEDEEKGKSKSGTEPKKGDEEDKKDDKGEEEKEGGQEGKGEENGEEKDGNEEGGEEDGGGDEENGEKEGNEEQEGEEGGDEEQGEGGEEEGGDDQGGEEEEDN